MTRHQIAIISALGAALILAYILFWPVPIDPAAWTPPKAPNLEGIYAPNDRLASVELLGKGVGIGPEDVALDSQGRIYGGMVDGKIVRLSSRKDAELFADTGGRPARLEFDSDGDLIVADGYKGLLLITPEGEIVVLSTEAEGLSFGLTDDLDIAEDGTIYSHEPIR